MDKSGKRKFSFRAVISVALPFVGWGSLTVLLLLFVLHNVDFRPKVNENFFFASDDPQLQADRIIARIFHQEQQIIISAGGNIRSPDYFDKVRRLTEDLAMIPGVDTVESLTHGPRSIEDALKSPLWKRVLFSEDGKATFIYVFLKEHASDEKTMLGIEKIKQRFQTPDFQLMVSGAPYIIELIQRNLLHDLKVFSIAAFCVFGLAGLLISRSVTMVFGTLIACTNAGSLTLILTHLFGIPIGPLTANLSTIVFVLTLTHMVFMTFNWRHILRNHEVPHEKAAWRAVRVTVLPSFWSMLTALLGFLSLLFVPATPLRQLGLSGAIGTVIAFSTAYLIYPFFLHVQKQPMPEKGGSIHGPSEILPFFNQRHGRIVAFIMGIAVIAGLGLLKLNTEPSLFSYFEKGGEIRNSLEYIDHNGGSSPLYMAIGNENKVPLKMDVAYDRLWRLQNALEHDSSVGSVVSLPLFLAEARRSRIVSLLPVDWILKLLESPILGRVARYYITKDQTKTLFIVRMKESFNQSDHLVVIERLENLVRENGFQPELIGGTYLLYGKLSKMVASSIVEGLSILILLFVIMGGLISRSLRVVAAMLISLGVIPVLMLGTMGHLSIPIDIISAPGPNIAIGIGVDAVIHTLIWVRRHPSGSMLAHEAWGSVCSRLYKPVLYSMSVVCAGFGIFILSGFPPTQRFGLSVVMGTLLSPLPALILLPWFATTKISDIVRNNFDR